ncbi:MAG: hypothetical protein ABSD74_01565 [Rhizomicrobium sp.]
MTRQFHLSPPGRGVSCDADGAFVGAIPILIRLRKNGRDEWQPHDCGQISKKLSAHFGVPVDMSSKRGGLRAIANALNEGDVARAQIAAVLLGIPDPPDLSKGARSSDQLIGFVRDLHWTGMLKWDSDKHPRWPAGSDDSKGGQFAPKGEGSASDLAPRQADPAPGHDRGSAGTEKAVRDPRLQLADAGMSDASDDPVAQAVARAGAASQHTNPTHRSPIKPANVGHESLLHTLASSVEQILSEEGNVETVNVNAQRAASDVLERAIEEGFEAYSRFMDHPIGGTVPITPDFPIWGYGDNMRLAPERPITREDVIGSVGNLAAVLPIGDAAEVTDLAATEATPFIILPKELPPKFDITLPVGRYAIPTNAVPRTTTYGDIVGDQIGKLVQDAFPSIKLVLRTSRGMKGVDIEIPIDYAPKLGFQFAEIKPLTNSGYSTFNAQVARWKLPDPVLPITYDYDGNIYYGFPR